MIILRQRAFSDNLEQKEFNSKAQKALRRAIDLKKGVETFDVASPSTLKRFPNNEKGIVDSLINRGRRFNKYLYDDGVNKSINQKAKELRKAEIYHFNDSTKSAIAKKIMKDNK